MKGNKRGKNYRFRNFVINIFKLRIIPQEVTVRVTVHDRYVFTLVK